MQNRKKFASPGLWIQKPVTPNEIQQQVFSKMAVVRKALSLPSLKECAKSGLTILDWLSQMQYVVELRSLTVDPDDYARSIQGLLIEVKGVCSAEDKLQKKEVQEADVRKETEVQEAHKSEESEVQVADVRESEVQLPDKSGESEVQVADMRKESEVQVADVGKESKVQEADVSDEWEVQVADVRKVSGIQMAEVGGDNDKEMQQRAPRPRLIPAAWEPKPNSPTKKAEAPLSPRSPLKRPSSHHRRNLTRHLHTMHAKELPPLMLWTEQIWLAEVASMGSF